MTNLEFVQDVAVNFYPLNGIKNIVIERVFVKPVKRPDIRGAETVRRSFYRED